MKLRLANLEYLVDINDLHDELGYLRVEHGPDPHRRHDPPPRAARVRRAGRRLPDLPRRRARHRRPGGAQPRHARRLAVPGRPVRGPLGGVHDARRQLRDPRERRRAGGVDGGVPPAARTRRRWATPRCSPRSASRSAPAGRAPTRRWSGAPATGPSCRPAPRCGWTAARSATRGSGLAAVGPNTTGIPAISEALRGQAPSEDLYAQAGALAAEACQPTTDMRGSVEYKRHLANELTRRALRRSVARINGEEA